MQGNQPHAPQNSATPLMFGLLHGEKKEIISHQHLSFMTVK